MLDQKYEMTAIKLMVMGAVHHAWLNHSLHVVEDHHQQRTFDHQYEEMATVLDQNNEMMLTKLKEMDAIHRA